MAAQLRETVSQVVRETAVQVIWFTSYNLCTYFLKCLFFYKQSKPQRAEPIDYEAVLTKNRIIFNNDPHRELLLFPPEDVSVSIFSQYWVK